MRYVAIDFETANNAPVSACSVGLAKMEDGRVIDTYYSLIKPASRYFSPFNISIHGIYPQDVEDAPLFRDIWPDILMFIDDDLLIAHNAPFDIGIVKALLTYYDLAIPPLHYGDTVRISRVAFPFLANHKLTTISRHFGFDYTAHHALDDAINCAKVFHAACDLQDEQEVVDYFLSLGIRFHRMSGGYAPEKVVRKTRGAPSLF